MLAQIVEQDWQNYLPKKEILLQYTLPEREDQVSKDHQVLAALDSELENILESHDSKKGEIRADIDDAEATQVFKEFLEEVVERERKVGIVYYEPKNTALEYDEEEDETSGNVYMVEDEESEFDYMFVPRGVQVQRVSQNVLGPNVLGRTWIGSGQIEVLDSLYGDAFQEVLLHEVNHLLYPHLNEREIRAKTRKQVNSPIYH